jgi:glycosyltransferase involved in cell wall biosynthesis
MKKIKLLVDGHWFDEPFQSMGVFIRGLYRAMSQDERFEIYIAAHDLVRVASEFNDCEFKYLKYPSTSKLKRLAIDVQKLSHQYNFDFIHFQYVLPLLKTCKEIVTIHDILFVEFPHLFPWSYRVSKKFLFSRSAKRAEIVTTVSNYSKEAICRHFRISKQRVHVIPNGISDSFYEIGDYPNESVRGEYNLQNYVLYVSRIEPRKNHITLVKAFVIGKFWEMGYKLVLVGRVDIEVNALNQYLDSLPKEIRNSVIFWTGIKESTLKDLYLNARLFVYPSLAEGFGIPPLEAAVLKTKTLCSNATAMSDFSFFEKDLISITNVEILIDAMKRKLSEEDSVMRESIAELVKTRYKWKEIAEKFSNLIITHELNSK